MNNRLPAHLLLGAAAAALLALPAGHRPGRHPDAPTGARAGLAVAGHGHHAEAPHTDPPEYDPTRLETISYSVTGSAGPGYAFRFRLPGEA